MDSGCFYSWARRLLGLLVTTATATYATDCSRNGLQVAIVIKDAMLLERQIVVVHFYASANIRLPKRHQGYLCV